MRAGLWFKDGLAFSCQKCSGCCGGFPGYVWVSDDEAGAIAAHLGMEVAEFRATYTRRAMSRTTFKEVAHYDCIMLKDGACSIYEVRPVQCRTFPFWDENLDTPADWASAARRCPGMNRGTHYTAEEIERIRQQRKY